MSDSRYSSLATVGHSELKVFAVDVGSEVSSSAPSSQGCSFKGVKLTSVAWNHTNQVLAVAGNKPQINLVQANNGQLLSTVPFTAEQAFIAGVSALAFSNNSRYLASAAGSFVHLWDLKRRNMKAYFGEAGGMVSCLAMSAEGDVVAGDDSGAVRVWDMKQQCRILASPTVGDSTPQIAGGVTCLQLSCVGALRIASGYSSGVLAVWDYQTGQQLRAQTIHPSHAMTGAAYSPKNARLVATVGSDGRMVLVDTGSKPSAPPSATVEVGDKLTSVSFHEDAIHCAVGTSSGYALLYDWRNVRKPLAKIDAHMPYPVASLAFPAAKITASTLSAGPSTTSTSATTANTPSKSKPATALSGTLTPSNIASNRSTLGVAAVNTQQQPSAPTISSSPARNSRLARSDQASSVSSLSVGSSAEAPPLAAQRQLHPHSPARSDKEGDAAAAAAGGLLRNLSPIQSEGGGSLTSSVSLPTSDAGGVQHSQNMGSSSVRSLHSTQTQPLVTISSNIFAAPDSKLPDPVTLTATVPSLAVFAPVPAAAAQAASAPASATATATAAVTGSVATPSSSLARPSLRTSSRTEAMPPPPPSPVSASNSKPTASVVAPSSSSNSIGNKQTHTSSVKSSKNSPFTAAPITVTSAATVVTPEFDDLRRALQPVTSQELQDALALLRYDVHKEIQAITREQVRQFAIAKEDNAAIVRELSAQLADLLTANKELRAENERLRRIY